MFRDVSQNHKFFVNIYMVENIFGEIKDNPPVFSTAKVSYYTVLLVYHTIILDICFCSVSLLVKLLVKR